MLLAASPLLADDPIQPVTVFEIAPGSEDSNPGSLTALGKGVVFTASTSEYGAEVFVSDGTAEGTRLLADLVPGPASSNPRSFVRVGDLVYFTAENGAARLDLYETDGAGATRVLTNIRSLYGNTGPLLLIEKGGEDPRLVAFDPPSRHEVVLRRTDPWTYSDWGGDGRLRVLRTQAGPGPADAMVTDGTLAGTFFLGIAPGDRAASYLGKLAIPTENHRLIVTNGQLAGTRLFTILGGQIGRVVGTAGRILFLEGSDASGQAGLWAFDEKEHLTLIKAGAFHDGRGGFDRGGVVNGRFLFSAGEVAGPQLGEPHGTDGTKVELLADLVPGPPLYCGSEPGICSGASLPGYFIPFRRETYFLAGDRDRMHVWRTDGTSERTVRVTEALGTLRELVPASAGLFVAGNELMLLPLARETSVKTTSLPCRLADSSVAAGGSATFEVEKRCGVPSRAYSVDLVLAGSASGRLPSTVRLSASGAVPPVESTLLFGKRVTRSTHSVDIGPHGISVHNEGPEAVEISLDVTGYEAPASQPQPRR